MSIWLRATSPTTVVIGPFVSTGATAQTAIECSSATIVDLYKNTSKSDITTTSAGANTMAHVANGYYTLQLTSADTSVLGALVVTADSTGSMSVWHAYQIVPATRYDCLMTETTTIDSTFAAGAQASSLLAMGVSVASSLVRVTACGVADASALVWITSVHTNVTTVDTVVDAIKIDTASSLAKIDIIDTVADTIKVDTASSLVWIASAHANLVTVDTVVDTIKVDTASSLVRITACGVADASSLAKIDIIDTVVDTIKVDTASSLAKIDIIDTVADTIKVDTASSLVWIASAHANIVTVDTVVDAVKIDTASSLVKVTAIPSSVWDQAIAPHVTSGTTGEALNAAGGAGDPWITELPGSYTGIQAGMIVASLASSTWDIVRANHTTVGSFGEVSTVASAVTAVWAAAEVANVAQASKLTAVQTDMTSSLVWIASAHANIITIDSVVDAVKVDTASSLAKIDIIDTAVDAIKVDTASSLVWIASAHANIGNLDTDVAAVKVDTASSLVWIASVHTNVGALNDISAADVNAQVVDALATDTYAEPGQGAPAATDDLATKIGYVYKFLRNKIETTSSTTTIYNDDGTTAGQKSTISDDGTMFTRGEYGSGA